ncbi:MAG: hypothetical protein WAK03_00125 [Methylocystis sp.]
MFDGAPAGFSCGKCAFWLHFMDRDGHCRLHAPSPVGVVNEVARWPRTHSEAFCGEGREPDDTDLRRVACAECIYWKHPKDGLRPVDLLDQLSAWWSRAGHCQRVAPRPSSASGYRACWRATHESDSCFQGKKKTG